MSAKVSKAEKQQQIERVGVAFEKMGMPPVTARVIGHLMIAEPPYLSFDELVEATQASKSTVSTAVQALQSEGYVDYITFPGDRKRYFQLFAGSWKQTLKDRLNSLDLINEVTLETLSMRSSQYPEFNETLKEVASLYKKLYEELIRIIENREEKRIK